MATRRLVLVALCLVAMATLVAPQCSRFSKPTQKRSLTISQSLQQPETIGLIAGIGGFALLIAFVFLFFRYLVYGDILLLDTFFDGGGNNNFAVVACGIVSRWLWAGVYLPIVGTSFVFGIVGQFVSTAVLSAPLPLFAIIAIEFRIKAPGAKTFLQVIHRRFGSPAHVITMIFAVLINLAIMGLVLTQGSQIFSQLSTGLSKELIGLLLCLAAGVFTVVGGVGGGLYMAYFMCAGVLGLLLYYFISAFYPTDQSTKHSWGFMYEDRPVVDTVCGIVQCARTLNSTTNLDRSVLTFSSSSAYLSGACCILAVFSYVFVNQAFWTSASTAKPRHAVWGFLTAGVAFFAIPFALSFVFSMGYWVTNVVHGYMPTSSAKGLPVEISQLTLGKTGDYMFASMTTAIVIMAVSAQIHSLAAIFVYDIYQTYINPFRGGNFGGDTASQYMSYNRRSVWVRHAATVFFAVLSYPAAVVFMSIHLPLFYKVVFVGIVVGPAVVPVCLSVLWHRTTGLGIVCGIISGLAAGIGSWLVYATSFPDGLADFVANTGRREVLVVGMGASLAVGGIVCILISLCSGGLRRGRTEEMEWEKCRAIDSPVKPWSLQYAVDYSRDVSIAYAGIPNHRQVRHQYRSAEVSAYVVGVLLTVLVLLFWPSLMLLAGVFSCPGFTVWTMLAIILAGIAALYLGLLPPFVEIIQLCSAPSQADRQQQLQQVMKTDVADRDMYVVEPPPAQEVKTVISADVNQSFPDKNVLHVTSHDLAPQNVFVASQESIPDDESSIVDNSDGLNVLSDPLSPTSAGARINVPATKPTPKTDEPITYPLSSSVSLNGLLPQPYNVTATDIPFNGMGAVNSPTTQFASAGGGATNFKTHVRLN